MKTLEYKGKKISNAVSALAIYYPQISNGGDYLKDAKKSEITSMLYLYAACRMAADKEARKLPAEEIMNEVDYEELSDPKSEFIKVFNELFGKGDGKNV